MVQKQAVIYDYVNTISSPHRGDNITRRAFLGGTLGLGVSLLPLLAGCNAPSQGSCSCDPTTAPPTLSQNSNIEISWYSDYANTTVYNDLITNFHANQSNITVKQIVGSANTDQQHEELVAQLKQGAGPDIMSLDVTWTEEFVDQKWLMPLCDWWPSRDRNNYLTIPLQMATVDCKVYAAPMRSDVGLLYYRTDLFSHPPATWKELAERAAWAQKNAQVRYGYVWQGDQYEGLFCNFLEVLGRELDLNDAQGFNAALEALERMGQWRGTISPPDILSYRENEALNKWVEGSAAFMRNWPNAIAISNDVGNSQVAGKFKIAPLPSGHSCIGGWQLGINAQSSPQKQAAAWAFVHYMLGQDAQQHLAMEEAQVPTLRTMYQEPELTYISRGKNPFVGELQPLLDKGLVRPASPCYQQSFSPTIQKTLHQALMQARPDQSSEQYRPIMEMLRQTLQKITCS